MTNAHPRLRRLLLCALCLTLVLPLPLCHAQDRPMVGTVFNEHSGLPTGEANDVLQTSDGYIWVGSYGGLIRYDGGQFRNFSTEGLLPSSSVRMLFEDSAGRLWIGTNDAGVFVLEGGQLTQPQGQPRDSFLCIRGFAQSAQGTVYACSNSGVGQIENGVLTLYDDPQVSGHTVYSLGVDRLGRVWAAIDNGCVVLQDGAAVASLGPEMFFDGGEGVYSVTSDPDGAVWLGGSENHLVRLVLSGDGLDAAHFDLTRYTLEKTSVINSIRALADSRVSVSGLHGYALVSPRQGVVLELSDDQGARDLNSSHIDYQGNIWLASTEQGVVRFTQGYFAPYEPQALDQLNLNAVALSGGKGYAGSNDGLTVVGGPLTDGDRVLMELLDGVRVRDVLADDQGQVWVASYSDSPVVRYTPATGALRAFSSADGLCSDHARVLCQLSSGAMAVGTQGGVSIIAGDSVRESYTQLDYPTILSLLELPGGALLAGSDGGGVYELRDGQITNHGFSEGLSEGVVLRMLPDTGENCFVSAGSSLYYMTPGHFEKLTALKKEAGSIFDLYLQDGTLWLLQNCGVLAVDRDDLLSGGDGGAVVYTFDHGLTGSLNANTRHCLLDGELYLATRSGVSVFSFQPPQSTLPKVVINSVTVDGVSYEHPQRLEVSRRARRVSIQYAVLSYNSTPARFQTSYELEGFDQGQSDVTGGQNLVSYTNLPGGEYTFHLRITSPDGGQSGECSFTLVKERGLWEHPLFWVCLLAGLVAMGALVSRVVYAFKLRRIRRRQQEYRHITEQSLLTFAGAIDAKDRYTKDHSVRVAHYSRELARRLGMSEEEQENIYYIALLHDVGKIGIPDQVLNKPGRLTDEEFHLIQTHPSIGGDILKNFTALEGIAEGARYHHERYDGKGYCEGKAGEDIPLTARIIAVADAYDAMSSDRCYRKGLPREVIEAELQKGAGAQFDPRIVPHMLAIIEDEAARRAAQRPG